MPPGEARRIVEGALVTQFADLRRRQAAAAELGAALESLYRFAGATGKPSAAAGAEAAIDAMFDGAILPLAETLAAVAPPC